MRTITAAFLATLTLALTSLAIQPVDAQVAVGTVLGENAAGYPRALIVMDNGDVYRSDFGPRTTSSYPQLPWVLSCNIFSAGGPSSRVVGLGGGCVLTAAGGTYRLGVDGPQPV